MSIIYCKTTSNPLISTFVNKLKLIVTSYVMLYSVRKLAILDFTLLKFLFSMSRVNKFCVASPDKTVVQKYFGKDFFFTNFP